MARRVFGADSPLGKRFRRYMPGLPEQDSWVEIVGVVDHVLNESPEKDPRPQVYWPESQSAQDRGVLVVRTAGHPESYAAMVISRIRTINPDQPVYEVRSMEDWVARSIQSRSLTTTLSLVCVTVDVKDGFEKQNLGEDLLLAVALLPNPIGCPKRKCTDGRCRIDGSAGGK